MANTIAELILEIQSLNFSLGSLVGLTRERARQDRDDLINRLASVANTGWHNHVRLTIMDDDRPFQNEPIKFTHPDGTVASVNDLATTNHILVMPEQASHTVESIKQHEALVKLDQTDVEWMAINSHHFLLIRFATGRLCLINNSYGIRALHLEAAEDVWW